MVWVCCNCDKTWVLFEKKLFFIFSYTEYRESIVIVQKSERFTPHWVGKTWFCNLVRVSVCVCVCVCVSVNIIARVPLQLGWRNIIYKYYIKCVVLYQLLSDFREPEVALFLLSVFQTPITWVLFQLGKQNVTYN